ncbi:Valacyclovir hydrolase [Folsomia candida]|uniref:Valacyclovir hydrolase n=1 Tax=Folsomia candida TaxID=158441 RepID=A0A226EAW9_FOLCA|nr:Valacyclovir hydrolase [Folsomia candida]
MASQTKHLVEITPEQIQEFKNLAKEQEKTFLSEDAIVDTVEHVDVSHLYQRIEVKGVSINYVKVGTGEKPVLLMCGSVGAGKSIPPERDFSSKESFLHGDIEFAKILMQKLGYPKFSILGWCGGGTEALMMAGKYPEVIESLISINSKAFFGHEDMAFYNLMSDISNWSELARSSMVKVYGEEYFFKCWMSLITLYKRIYDEEEGNLCTEFLSKIKCPTLLVHGQLDPVAPVRHVHFIKERIPHAKVHIMEKGKHNLHLRYPEEFLAIVEQFLLELS